MARSRCLGTVGQQLLKYCLDQTISRYFIKWIPMRTFEIVILFLNLAALLTLYVPLRHSRSVYAGYSLRWLELLPAALIVVTIVHLMVEKYRWQMMPSYVLTVVLLLSILPSLLKGRKKSSVRGVWLFVTGGVAILWWMFAATLPIILPVMSLPTPPGAYAIGSVVYHWTDTTRDEIYSSDPNDKRELMVQIWYPAQPTAASRTVPLIDNFDVALPALAKVLQIPAFVLEHVRLVTTHTYGDAPIRDDQSPYPVVISSHGGQSYRTASFNQMEALASSGYVAIAIDHPYAAAFTAFPDGRVILSDLKLLPKPGRNQPGDQEKREKWQTPIVADQRFVIDQLQRLNEGKLDARFAGRLDLQHIGLTGVSLGGGAAAWTCHIDMRCKAGLAQDGWYEAMPKNLISQSLKQPFMFMQSETKSWKGDNIARLDRQYQGVSAPAFRLKLAGVLHNDFGDYPLLSPVSAILPERGTLKGDRTLKVVNAYLIAFFDQYLKNQPSPLLNGAAINYPEVQFDAHN
jgi:predicted dienelactone hydrolase